MRVPLFPLLLLGCAAGCAGPSSTKPVEVLDERTGVTMGTLKEPIELVPSTESALVSHKRFCFAYLGPIEWDRSGTLSYGLWVHIAPGIDRQPGDIHASGAVSLIVDDGPLAMTLATAPKLGRDAYRQVVSWGQTAYFDLDVGALRRMAASRKLELDVRALDGSIMSFTPSVDTRAVLTEYVQARSLSE
jgi:hypothetical protein